MAAPILNLPNGLRLYLDTEERVKDAGYIAAEIFEQRTYQRPGFELLPTDLVVDIGAHTGLFALWTAPQVPQGRIVCIEPTDAIESLRQSFVPNHLSNITILRCAVGPPSSQMELSDCPAYGCLSRSTAFRLPFLTRRLLEKSAIRERTRVITSPCRSLEEIMHGESLPHIDFLKVDCEGGEYAILDHSSDGVLRKVKRIAMEFHEFHSSHDHRQLVRRLESCGFKVQIQKPWLKYHLYKVGMLWACR